MNINEQIIKVTMGAHAPLGEAATNAVGIYKHKKESLFIPKNSEIKVVLLSMDVIWEIEAIDYTFKISFKE